MGEFAIHDCTLLTRTSGLAPAINLRELRDRLAISSQDVLYHHFCETPLLPSFDNPDYRNDFVVWAMLPLGDHILLHHEPLRGKMGGKAREFAREPFCSPVSSGNT